jgi:hypothetical protein
MEENAPRAARIYALLGVANFDGYVAAFDAKYTYWAPRPFMLDPEVKPIFPTPNHPSYPAAEGAAVAPYATVLAYLFPSEADALNAKAEEAVMSRLWAGIHFRSDIEVGLKMGHAIGQQVVAWAQADGAQ